MSELNARQIRAIGLILGAPNYTEGIENAGICRKTFYQWLKQPGFKAELDRQRKEIAEDAFRILESGLTKAVKTLIDLMNTDDNRLKRLVCNDIIEHILQHKDNEDLEKRLIVIEQRLAEKPD